MSKISDIRSDDENISDDELYGHSFHDNEDWDDEDEEDDQWEEDAEQEEDNYGFQDEYDEAGNLIPNSEKDEYNSEERRELIGRLKDCTDKSELDEYWQSSGLEFYTDDKEVMLLVISVDPVKIETVDDKLLKDKDIVMVAINSLHNEKLDEDDVADVFSYTISDNDDFNDDPEVVQKFMEIRPDFTYEVFDAMSDDLKNDVKFLASLYNNKNIDKLKLEDTINQFHDDECPSLSKVKQMAKILKNANNAKDNVEKTVDKNGPK